MEDEDCNSDWILIVVIFMAITYAAFLLFQKNLKDFLFMAPLGKKSVTKRVREWKRKAPDEMIMGKDDKMDKAIGPVVTDGREDELNWEAPMTQEEEDEGGIFLILLFYYFQDAALVHTKTVYVVTNNTVFNNIKTIVGGIFKFRLDVLHLANTVCTVVGLLPAEKIIFKLLFVPLLLLMLVTVYVTSLIAEKRVRNTQIWDFLARRAALGIMFAILFSYQKLASSMFQLIHCVQVGEDSVLFVDGEITCYQPWQALVFIYLALCICPFFIYIAVGPALMKNGYITLPEFFAGCLFPVPMALYWIVKYSVANGITVEPKDDAVSVYKLLQGPYREFQLPGILRYLCWSGVLLGRRLALIFAATFIHDVILRLSVMLIICISALLYHVVILPCKETRGNLAGTVSNAALLIVCIVNFLKAAYESAEYIPTGSNFELVTAFEHVENSLLLWIPLAGIGVILLVLITRLGIRASIYSTNTRRPVAIAPSPKGDKSIEDMQPQPKCDRQIPVDN